MIIYSMVIKYVSLDERIDDRDTLNPEKDERKLKEIISDMNDMLGCECGLDGNISMAVIDGRIGHLNMVLVCRLEKIKREDWKKWIRKFLMENYSLKKIIIDKCREMTALDFKRAIEKADRAGYVTGRWLSDELGFDYFDNRSFKVQEKIYTSKYTKKTEIMEAANLIMADASLTEEIERIYSDENEKKYYGNPVHYKITAGNMDSAGDIIEILIKALKSNNRILGTRITNIHEIDECCHHDSDVKNLFMLNSGSALIIDMSGTDEDHGVYASAYHEVIADFSNLIKQNQLYTLFVFVEISDHPGFTNQLIASVQDNIHLIEIKEGRGDRNRALDYLDILTKKSSFEATRKELEAALPVKKSYSAAEVHNTYNKWFSVGLKSKVYRSYRACEKVAIKVNTLKDHPYEELQNMVGLSEIKKLVDQIINNFRVKKARSKLGMDTYNISQHMMFTGNPGSAKTTVARLIAEILKKEGIIESGNFVECSRGDLVAKYVGWTAKNVHQRFMQARGGVLFIDEAYSLVDGSNSFGDEAINTIVQEMENLRDEVIVIFAGYSDRMEEFLGKNEGLRSRIAFHLDFPDYNPQEMVQILQLMAKDKGYKLNDAIISKCASIFVNACKNSDFGKGRFARTILEQAMLRQSDRIVKSAKGRKIGRRALMTLKEEDFDVVAGKQYERKEKVFGFGA